MGNNFELWTPRQNRTPETYADLTSIIHSNRKFNAVEQLTYGDYGLEGATDTVKNAIKRGKRIALYADYDVDGTMSCVSWIWFLEAIGYTNYTYYIPCRFEEGYGLNLDAMKHLIDNESAELIITMDTGITANEEAAYCLSRGVDFVCTDHHKVQKDKMPDCVILNPKLHPDPDYQELCGCGITFVLLRRLAKTFPINDQSVWTDILALAGMATICDVVPLNGVNHRLANLGVQALARSQRLVIKKLRHACADLEALDEQDVGFRIGPRINAVGRLKHANAVIEAFIHENPDQLIQYMGECNEERKTLQKRIVDEAMDMALQYADDPILFLGGDWHPGVVGIAASKVAEKYWKPTWMFNHSEQVCKGSARSIPDFDVTDAMGAAGHLFDKFGGHKAAAGYSFSKERIDEIRASLISAANDLRMKSPDIWQSKISYDCHLPLDLANLELISSLDSLKPFGHGFEEPLFEISAEIVDVIFYKDKLTGLAKHTAVTVANGYKRHKIMFFNEVYTELESLPKARFLVSATKNHYMGRTQLSLIGRDWEQV